jgi:hypothetical protein
MRYVICGGFHKREEVSDRSGRPQPARHVELEERAVGSRKAQLEYWSIQEMRTLRAELELRGSSERGCFQIQSLWAHVLSIGTE